MYNILIRRCLDLAKLHKGKTKTNPLVGAVLMKENKIIGEGAHEQYGAAHAEVNAINGVKNPDDFRGSSIAVSLEPCFHYGKTPPCVNLILDKKIPKVIIACTDPNPLVVGKSINLLQKSDIQVVVGIEEYNSLDIIKPFVTGIKKQRPYIVLKYAHSADGFLGYPDQQIWLTNSFSKHLVHKWRSETDAILVGKNTVLSDNPDLTNRLYFGKKHNVRIVLDTNLAIPENYKIFDGSAETWILTKKESGVVDVSNIRYFKSDFEGDYLQRFMHELYEQKIGTLIVEGGAKVLQSFIEANLWDEARVFKTTKILGEGAIPAPLLDAKLLKSEYRILDDLLQIYQNVP